MNSGENAAGLARLSKAETLHGANRSRDTRVGVMRKSAHRSWKVGLFARVLAAPGSGIESACCHLFLQRQLFHQTVCLHVVLNVPSRFPKRLVRIYLVFNFIQFILRVSCIKIKYIYV